MARTLSRDQILDAAELLFADAGFEGVSVKQIASHAGVGLALLTHQFRSKEEILRDVLERRARKLNQMREEALQICLAADLPPSLEDLIEGYLRPLLDMVGSGDPGWDHYTRLVAAVSSSPIGHRQRLHALWDRPAAKYLEALCRLFPKAEPASIHHAFHFTVSVMLKTYAQSPRMDRLSDGVARASELATLHVNMVRFMVGGFRALTSPTATQRPDIRVGGRPVLK